MDRRKAFKIGLLAVVLFVSAVTFGRGGPSQPAPPSCTVTVQPGESIQAAIDRAAEGDVVCLAKGTWEENVKIEKSLTLRGAGQEKTVIKGKERGYPVVWITVPEEATQTASIKVEGLTMTGAYGDCADWYKRVCPDGMLIQGKIQATISGSSFSKNGHDGISLRGSSRATISDSSVSGNWYGIVLGDSSRATISDSSVSQNGNGIWLGDSARATISGSSVSGNWVDGIVLVGSSRVTVSNSSVSENVWDGIWLGDSARVTIYDSPFSENWDGIVLGDSARATISNSSFSENWDGILLWGSAQATITENRIEGNGGCGISSWSSGEVQGERNRMSDNGNDLCGNLPGSLRVPLVKATEAEITYPDGRYTCLQEAVDALLPGGVLRLQTGTYQAGVTITKPMRIEAAKGAEVTLKGRSDGAPVLSLVGGAELELVGLRVTGGEEGLLLGADAQATISGSSFSKNEYYGIWLGDSARAIISGSSFSKNRNGIVLGDSARATIESNKIINNKGYGVALYQQPCYPTNEVFKGHVSGKANTIPGPDEPNGNKKGAVCPSPELDFLMTEQGGEFSGGS